MAVIRAATAASSDVIELEGGPGGPVAVVLVINPRARRVAVRIDGARRRALAIAPSKRQAGKAMAFAAERAGWIAQQLALLPEAKPFAPDAIVPIRGAPVVLRLVPGRAPARLEAGVLALGAPDTAAFARRVKRFLVAQAQADIERAIAVHAETLGVAPTRVALKDTRSRWGSCSAAGVLAFSWRVILAPPSVLDYLVAHEVAHLREMNHSPRFWALVRKCVGEPLRERAWLRRHGPELHAYGAWE